MSLPLWPREQLGHALAHLLEETGTSHRSSSPLDLPTQLSISTWMSSTARHLDVELSAVGLSVPTLHDALLSVGPALVPVDGGYLAVVGSRGRRLMVLEPGGKRRTVSSDAVADRLVAPVRVEARATIGASVHAAMADAGLDADALLRPLLADTSIDGIVVVQPGATARAAQLRRRVVRDGVALLVAQVVRTAVLVASWMVLGTALLDGATDRSHFLAWGGLLALGVSLAVGSRWVQVTLSHRIGTALHGLILREVLAPHPRHTGRVHGPARAPGDVLGRVLEAESLDVVAVEGGLLAGLSLVDLAVSVWVLSQGPAASLQLLALAGWCGWMMWGAARQVQERRRWSAARISRTQRTVDALRGHRTDRALGLGPESLAHEDSQLRRELVHQQTVDRLERQFSIGSERGVLVTGVLLLLPHLDAGASGIAIAVGGLLLAAEALGTIAEGVAGLADADAGVQAIRPLLSRTKASEPTSVARPAELPADAPVKVRGLHLRHPAGALFEDWSIVLHHGGKALLVGPSRSGKSSLARIVAGLEFPDSGMVQCGGQDPQSMGSAAWSRVVALAPQFDDNHIFTGTLAFNLLLGRHWPPRPADLVAAQACCSALGLGPLLDAMPGGLEEQVGESGWQLSHGERSRVFLARALLQDARLVIADDSLAALDPQTETQVRAQLSDHEGGVLLLSKDEVRRV